MTTETSTGGMSRRKLLVGAAAGGAVLAAGACGAVGYATRAQYEAEIVKLRTVLGLHLRRDPDMFTRVVERFRLVDWGRYLTVVRHLHEHDAEPYLARIRKPTLVACGTRDILTPLSVARRMSELIAGSELFVVPRATHYIVVEYGELVASRIGRFLDKIAVGAAPA